MMKEHHSRINWLTAIEHIGSYSAGIAKDIFKLFSLEVKLARKSLVAMLILSVAGILLLLSCWLSLLGAGAAWLISLHISIPVSFLLIAALNLLIAIITLGYIARLGRRLTFKETRQQLTFNKQSGHSTIARQEHEKNREGN